VHDDDDVFLSKSLRVQWLSPQDGFDEEFDMTVGHVARTLSVFGCGLGVVGLPHAAAAGGDVTLLERLACAGSASVRQPRRGVRLKLARGPARVTRRFSQRHHLQFQSN
jgi:hypothetical protein